MAKHTLPGREAARQCVGFADLGLYYPVFAPWINNPPGWGRGGGLLIQGRGDPSLCPRYLVPGTWYQVPGTWF